jgi:predicted enzyme related to lactoylglutathione lyase
MPPTTPAPVGAPVWVDLMTSDPARSIAFYGALFGWEAEEPNPDFGGYSNFLKGGARIAGCMINHTEPRHPDVWSVYLAADNAEKTLAAAEAEGGQIVVNAMPVEDLGTMGFLVDSGGAAVGLWQPGTHQGFGLSAEPGAPAWFELFTRDYDRTIAFYQNVFSWKTHTMGDTPEFRYTTLEGESGPLAGVMDASAFLPEGVPAHWSVYFGTADTDATLAQVTSLGGTVVQPAEDTPYGRLATATDPTGAQFKLVAPNP